MVPVREYALDYVNKLKDAINSMSLKSFEDILHALLQAYHRGNSIFIMGNGGSGATASHFTCDINKGVSFGLPKRLKVLCLNDNMPTLLAYANDVSFEGVFVEQLKNFLNRGDIVIGVSGSGNSTNIVKALQYANQNAATSIALTGFNGGRLAKIAHISMVVGIDDMQKVEDIHMILVHMLMQALYKKLREKQTIVNVCEVATKKEPMQKQPITQETVNPSPLHNVL